MKTRTLLLLSVGCGLSILVAGVVLMLQLASQPAPTAPLAIGTLGRAGDLSVTPLGSTASDSTLTVEIEWSGPPDADAADGFVLVAPDRVVRPEPSAVAACGAPAAAVATCSLVFDVADLQGTARQLVLERGGEKVRWSLT